MYFVFFISVALFALGSTALPTRRYKRNAVHDVVCVYPGDPVQASIRETGSGYFLQLFPDEEGNIVGLKELMELLKDWCRCNDLS